MSDDETMSDMSQRTEILSKVHSDDVSSISIQPDLREDSWGKIRIYEIPRRRSIRHGSVANHPMKLKKIFQLVKERTTFGLEGDCSVAHLIDATKLVKISSIHFTITKNDVTDPLCPIFVEDSSTNGTFFRQYSENNSMKYNSNIKRIDKRIKRRIMADGDSILIEKWPTICFEFNSHQTVENNLPNDIEKEFHIGPILGRGAFGVVYSVQDRQTFQLYALKVTYSDNEDSINNMLKEVEILEQLNHPCILQLYKKQTYVDSVAIVVDLMKGGDLCRRLQRCGHISESHTKFLFYQICCGVQYLHSKLVTHRDLKPENILLATADTYTLVKLADFGLSKCVRKNSRLQTVCGTQRYMAPEVRSGSQYTNKVDIWSLGVILYECFCAKYPFSTKYADYDVQFKQEHKQWNAVSEEAKKIICETLRVNALERPSAEELLNQRNWLSKNDESVERAREIINNSINEKL